MITTTRTRRALHTAFGILLLALMLFPVYWMVNTSFQGGGTAASSAFFPTDPTLDGYRLAFSQQLPRLGVSLVVALGTVLLTLAIAAPAAYAVAKFALRGKGVFMFALLLAQMIPGIVIANSLYTLFNDLRIVNTIPGLILADATHAVPFAILIMSAFMRSIPDSIVEAARVDGATQFRAFWSIVLPVSRNALITAGLFSFLFAWSDFIFALTLTTDESVKPITLGIYNYLQGNVQSWGPVMATAVIASIPALVLLIFAQRYIAAGAAGGAVK
ncbi:carbohydrate ABC transporter permease [Microbacterium excoecariae]|uniref:carbohydrate ABC transporter permease n=1 Tax=Microbacterium excoecariae TaxID=2715210 RepID=UPI00140C49AF|nr:carbohydrate ABC transporter permease [Microbacterium excoecariae]NHI17718.1 carbohydrate ABC transporter permease [Microbacterium excoecariae]